MKLEKNDCISNIFDSWKSDFQRDIKNVKTNFTYSSKNESLLFAYE